MWFPHLKLNWFCLKPVVFFSDRFVGTGGVEALGGVKFDSEESSLSLNLKICSRCPPAWAARLSSVSIRLGSKCSSSSSWRWDTSCQSWPSELHPTFPPIIRLPEKAERRAQHIFILQLSDSSFTHWRIVRWLWKFNLPVA